MPRDGADTKAQIQTVAMRMFVERGYDKTSLREIAEEIGVTKAALYYHFRTKEDIVRAAMAQYSARITETLDWLESAAGEPDRHEQLVDRLLDIFTDDDGVALKFGQANPTAMANEDFGQLHMGQIMRLMGLLAGEHPGPEQTTRATLAFGALVIGTVQPMLPPEAPGPLSASLSAPMADRRAAARKIALELLAPLAPQQSAS